jgi:phosphatidylglycerophosphate synthase
VTQRAELDARAAPGEVPATALVGGIPLLIRPLRQLARRGWSAARVVADDEAAVRGALARYPVAIDVEVASAPADAALRLDARAIYRTGDLPEPGAGGPPEPIARVRSRADTAAAERALFALIRKSVELDGAISYYVIRPLARVATRLLLPTRIAPNHVTFAALSCALAAALLAATGSVPAAALAGALYWLGGALDHVDGELARLRLQSSKLGEWLDAMTDEVSTYSLLAGLGVGLWRGGAGAEWMWIGVGGSAIGAIAMARVYVDLHRMGLPIDSAQFPWFFRREESVAPARRGPVGIALAVVSALGRRDANVTGVALLLLVGWREVAAALVAAGAAIGAIVTLTHYVVTAMRPARTPR